MSQRRSFGDRAAVKQISVKPSVAAKLTLTVIGVILTAMLPAVTRGMVTEASWQDSAFAGGTLSATTLPPPTLTAPCQYVPATLSLDARVEVYWNPPSGFSVAEATVQASQSGLGSLLAPLTGFSMTASTTYDADKGHFVTIVPTNLLGGLLGLNTELELAVVMERDGWTSTPAKVATNAGLLAGIAGTCRNIT